MVLGTPGRFRGAARKEIPAPPSGRCSSLAGSTPDAVRGVGPSSHLPMGCSSLSVHTPPESDVYCIEIHNQDRTWGALAVDRGPILRMIRGVLFSCALVPAKPARAASLPCGSASAGQTRNKHDGPKSETPNEDRTSASCFDHSQFAIWICFGFRISCFGFQSPASGEQRNDHAESALLLFGADQDAEGLAHPHQPRFIGMARRQRIELVFDPTE